MLIVVRTQVFCKMFTRVEKCTDVLQNIYIDTVHCQMCSLSLIPLTEPPNSFAKCNLFFYKKNFMNRVVPNSLKLTSLKTI